MPNYPGITQILRIFFQSYLLLGLPVLLTAQEEPVSGEILENYFRDVEQASEADAQLLLEQLERYSNNPLDLNKASRDEIASLQLLNALQIEQLLNYREQLGPLLNELELQAVPGWTLQDIQRVRPFVRVGKALDQRNMPLQQGFYKGKNELLLRWGRTASPLYPSNSEGDPSTMAFRFRHEFDNRLRFGITGEKDPGEAFFAGSNSGGFDFYSVHLFAQDITPNIRAIALGDYSARFGQGVLLQTGFTPGKSAESISIARGGRKIRPYTSFGEAFFFRGAGVSLAAGGWEATLLYSNRKRDANILFATDTLGLDDPEVGFSSLQSSGLHRTPSEISDENALGEQVAAASITHQWHSGQVSVNGVYYQYDKPWEPSFSAYRQFVFRGSTLSGLSVDYDWHYRNLLLFGETARSENGGIAAVNGLLFGPDRRTTFAILHRSLARDYQAIYGAPFSETSTGANENGVYVGVEIKPNKPWRFNAFSDIWRHPWLRFGVDAPSSGWDYLLRSIWTPKRGVSFTAIFQSENKETSGVTEDINGLLRQRRDRFRLHAAYKVSSAVELRSRAEWTHFQLENATAAKGFVAYQEFIYRPLGTPFSGAFRYTIYDTDSYDARVYTFENDLFAALSVPAFSGRGSRYFLNISWRVNNWLRLESRFEQTLQTRVVTTGNLPGKRTAFKLQARAKF